MCIAGLNLGGGGSDDFLEKLAKKISKPSESEDAMTSDLAALTGGAAAAAAAASLNGKMNSDHQGWQGLKARPKKARDFLPGFFGLFQIEFEFEKARAFSKTMGKCALIL